VNCRVRSIPGSRQVHCLSTTAEPDENLVISYAEVDFDAVAGPSDAPCSLFDRGAEIAYVARIDTVDAKQRGEGHTGYLSELRIGWEPESDRVIPRYVGHRFSVAPSVTTAVTIGVLARTVRPEVRNAVLGNMSL